MIAERPRSATATRPRGRTQAAPAVRPAQRGPVTAPQPRHRREPNAPMAQRGPRALRHARQLRWRSPETAAVLAASFTVSLLLLYVAAYARVTAEGFEAATLAHKLRAAQKEEDALRMRIGELSSPDSVARRAQTMGMVSGAPATMNVMAPGGSSAPVAAQTSTGAGRPF